MPEESKKQSPDSLSFFTRRIDFYANYLEVSQKILNLQQINERRFRDAIMPDVVTDDTKRYKVPEKWRPANIVR